MSAPKFVAFALLAAALSCDAAPTWERSTLALGGTNLQLEVAMTPEAQRQGLMFREELNDNAGMLFPFEPPRPVAMWMKNTLIDLDAAFIDACGEIFQISHMKAGTLDVHRAVQDAAFVLETNAGWFERHKVIPGMTIQKLMNPKYCRANAQGH